jgi:hypothetical protein
MEIDRTKKGKVMLGMIKHLENMINDSTRKSRSLTLLRHLLAMACATKAKERKCHQGDALKHAMQWWQKVHSHANVQCPTHSQQSLHFARGRRTRVKDEGEGPK